MSLILNRKEEKICFILEIRYRRVKKLLLNNLDLESLNEINPLRTCEWDLCIFCVYGNISKKYDHQTTQNVVELLKEIRRPMYQIIYAVPVNFHIRLVNVRSEAVEESSFFQKVEHQLSEEQLILWQDSIDKLEEIVIEDRFCE